METVGTMIGGVTSVFTAAIGWTGEVLQVVADNPIAFIMCVGVPLTGLAFGLASRLIRI